MCRLLHLSSTYSRGIFTMGTGGGINFQWIRVAQYANPFKKSNSLRERFLINLSQRVYGFQMEFHIYSVVVLKSRASVCGGVCVFQVGLLNMLNPFKNQTPSVRDF